MKTATLKVGDRIRCNVRGQVFTATFRGPNLVGGFAINPASPSVTYRHVTARQIVGKVEQREVGVK